MNALVSILVPVYNASQWLRQCLDSIVAQSYESLRAVIALRGLKRFVNIMSACVA